MHNVRPGFPGFQPGKLDLSNTPLSKKTLSFLKPPHPRSSFAAFCTVLDGIEAPGKGNEEPFRVPSVPCSARFHTFPSEEARRAYWRPGSYLTRAGCSRLFLSFLLNPLGATALKSRILLL